MTFRIESASARAAFAAVAPLCLLFLAFFSIRPALADHFLGQDTQSGYERAVRLEPGNAQNWYTLGRYWQYNLENPDSAAALAAYRASLAIDPIAWEVWLDNGTLLESEGKLAEARSAFAEAKRAYPISAEVAWRYGNFLLRQGEIDSAFAEFRHAVDVDPLRAAEAFSRCSRVEPNVQTVLDRAIPPSRRVYLDIIRSLVLQNQLDDALAVWRRLPASDKPIVMRDVRYLVDGLLDQKRLADASAVWSRASDLAGLAALQPSGSVLWDGGFESDVVNFGFAWHYPAFAGGVQITRDSTEKHSGHFSLRLSFDGQSNLYFHNVCQVVPVDPRNRYTLTAWTHTRGLTTDEGVRIELHAVSKVSPGVEVTSAPLGDQPWSQTEFVWSLPPDAREASVCLVRNPSAAPDNRIRGEFWIDDVALRPAAASDFAPKP
jgi:tetratricopeptide (TPR) repeat protein